MLEDNQLPPILVDNLSLDCPQKYNTYAQEFLKKMELLCSNNLHGDSVYKFISNRIKDLNLHNTDFRDVISEAAIRGLDYINKNGKPIQNPKAWIRVTSSNILLEEFRKAKKNCSLSNEILETHDFSSDFDSFNNEDGEPLSENPTKALAAFHRLSKPERRIIVYKLFQGKSYREINNLSVYQQSTEAALRKQYSRAIKNLRQIFNGLQN
jgi:RNA polymerase sigma factor (sigma-70 family)